MAKGFARNKSRASQQKKKNRNMEAVRKFRAGDINVILMAGAEWQYEKNMARIANGDYHLVD